MGEDDKANVRVYKINVKYFYNPNKICTDSYIFKLHYQWTFVILVAFSILMTGKELFGDPIDCISRDDIPANLLDTFCWIHSTFSLPNAWKKKVGEEIPYPGVDKHSPGVNKVYHAYYQWVCIVLFLQATLFFFPWYLWKHIEGKRIANLILGLNSPVVEKSEKKASLALICEYLKANSKKHAGYLSCYLLVHLLNLLNVIGQIFLVNKFLGGAFTTYGIKVAQFSDWDWKVRYDPMVEVFPRLVKCTFFKYGSSGDIQKHDAMCILPLNIMSEKIYIFIWFWFIILAILSGIDFIYRIISLISVKVFAHEITWKNPLVEYESLEVVVRKIDAGSRVILNFLMKNIDRAHFPDLIRHYRDVLQESAKTPMMVVSQTTVVSDNGNEKTSLLPLEI